MRFLPLLLVFLAGVRSAPAQVSEEALQCFKWFSTLGYPEVKAPRWAEIWYDYYWDTGDGTPLRAVTTHGFIMSEAEAEFTVLRLDLTQRTLTKSKPGTPAHRRVAFEERSFLDMARQQLDELEHTPRPDINRFDARLNHKAEVFFLAYACWQRGEEGLAASLYTQAQKLDHTYIADRKAVSMQEALEIDLGHAAMWDAVLRCGGGRLGTDNWRNTELLEPRAGVLEAFRRVVRLFPRCAHVERAKQSAAMLERMIEEDKRHVTLSQEQIDKLPQDQRIAELVWLLRDQNGHQMSQPGGCDVFDGWAEKGVSPAHQLFAIGDAAAPALIAALTDERFSRSVGFHRDFRFSHAILTVGECARQILNCMTGQDFRSPGPASGTMSDEDHMRGAQKVAQAWWEESQQKGKKQMLVDSISAGKTPPHRLVQQLKEEAPNEVTEAVLQGADRAQEAWLAYQFVSELAVLKSPAATQRLVKFMQKDHRLRVRLNAAASLLKQGHPDALTSVFDEWVGYPAEGDNGMRDGFGQTVDLLLASGDDLALNKLLERWAKRSVPERLEIVRKLGAWFGVTGGAQLHAGDKSRLVSPQGKAMVVEFLVQSLEDVEVPLGSGGPRVCDVSLWALHQIDPAKYACSPQASQSERDAERKSAANVWRQDHRLPRQ